jgi:hypothetical protein
MQKQFASFIATKGTAVVVNDAATMVPAVQMVMRTVSNLEEKSDSKTVKDKKAVKQPNRPGTVSGLESGNKLNRPNRLK